MDKITSKRETLSKSESEKFRIVRGKNECYGLINSSSKLVEDFRYKIFEEFKCGHALVIMGYGDNTNYGYLSLNGNVQWLPKIYSEVYSFSEDLAMVVRFYSYEKQMYGFINFYLNEIIPLKYYGARSFNEGLAAVENDNRKWGFIDKKGNQVIPFKYDGVEDFNNDLAIVYIGHYQNYKYGFINKNGEEVVPLIYDNVQPFSEGLAVAMKIIEAHKIIKYGYINIKGDVIIPLLFNSAESFSEGLAAISMGIDIDVSNYMDYSNYRDSGYINTKGDIVIPLQFKKAESFSEGLAAVSPDFGKKYYIDKYGKQITPELKYNLCGPFINGIIDRNGKVLVDPICSRIKTEEDCFIVDIYNREIGYSEYYLYDKKGNKLTPTHYNEFYSFIEELAIVCIYKKIISELGHEHDYSKPLYGFIDKRGAEIAPCIYEDITEFRDGIAGVKINGLWGFIDREGKLISKIEFDDICLYNNEGYIYSLNSYNKVLTFPLFLPKKMKYFLDDIGFVVKNNKYGIINKNGIEITPCIYDAFKPFDKVKSNDLISYKRNDKKGFINRKGVELCGPIYWDVFYFSDGLAACFNGKNWGFINEKGDVVIPFKYFSVGCFYFGLASVKINNLWGYINKFDIVVIKPQYSTADNFFIDENENIFAIVMKWDNISHRNIEYLIDTKGKLIEELF